MNIVRKLLIVPLVLLLVIACQEDEPTTPTVTVAPTAAAEPTVTVEATATLPIGGAVATIPAGSQLIPATLYDAISADLLTRIDATNDDIGVLRAEEAIWSDGALGCPTPGVDYTQATVEGYWVVLLVGGQQYDYRVGEAGYFILCERSFLPGGGAPSG